jgi:hypothetical protein
MIAALSYPFPSNVIHLLSSSKEGDSVMIGGFSAH